MVCKRYIETKWYRNIESKREDKYTKCNQDKVAISILILKEVDLINNKWSLLHLVLI